MKAARIRSFGGSEKIHLEEVATPKAKKNEALILVHAAAVNPADWMIREKLYNPEGANHVPMTLGQDFSGVIEKIGKGSRTDFKEGDAVFGEVWGSYAQQIVCPLKDLVKKPDSIDFEVAASIPMPGLTAWQMVTEKAKAVRGMKLLIHGASGGVGSFAAQFAKWKGCTVIATASPPSFDWLRQIGVDEIIDYRKERFEEKVRDVDVVIDPLGGELQDRSWQTLKKRGLLINLVGEIDHAAAKKYQVRGLEFGMRYDTGDLEQITRLIAKGIVKPHISKVLPLDQARKAMDLNQHGESHGKIILKVA